MRPDPVQRVILLSVVHRHICKSIEIEARRVIRKHCWVTNEARCLLSKLHCEYKCHTTALNHGGLHIYGTRQSQRLLGLAGSWEYFV